jgi:glyoxylase-like metal-dependent hydrolase (beta-lactamase superfamily II)
VRVLKIHDGLWRWTASDPGWASAGDEGAKDRAREVGCIYYEGSPGVADATVLIDPLVPAEGTPEAERFWRALDRDAARVGLPIAVLLGAPRHARSAQRILDRYRSTVGASLFVRGEKGRAHLPEAKAFEPGDPLPSKVQSFAVEGLQGSEVAYFIPEHRALVVADALVGVGDGRVRLAPPSWAPPGDAEAARYCEGLRASLARLAELPVDMLLVSHGEPILAGGREALAEALSAPPWAHAYCPDSDASRAVSSIQLRARGEQ